MSFKLVFTPKASEDFAKLEQDANLIKRLKAVRKALAYLENNPRHKSLNTHEFTSLSNRLGIKVFEAYAENNTPAAYRIFWCYGPNSENITIIAITAHP